MFERLLLKIARSMLQGVFGEITKQLNVIEQQAKEPLNGFVKEVMGGAWQGPDADRFVNEVSNMIGPKVNDAGIFIKKFHSGIERALQAIEGADKQATQMVGELDNVFSKIY